MEEPDKNSSAVKLYLTLTIDAEDSVGNVPNKFECNFSDGTSCGVDYIMDTLESYGMRGIFFVNVYEEGLYSGKYEGYMANLLQRIHKRGHEVGLHAHPSTVSLECYNTQISRYDLPQQTEIIEWGCDYIEQATGVRPISFRGGAYSCNEDTFQALQDCGILYDSTYYYGNSGNKFQTYESLNQACKIGDLTEFPIIQAIRSNDKLSKLDFNSMSAEDIIAVLEQMKEREGFNTATIMFHSFSFIDQIPQDSVMPEFQDGKHIAYGPRADLQQQFTDVLAYIQNDPEIEVVTFRQMYDENLPIVTRDQVDADGIFSAREDSETLANFTFDPTNQKDSPAYTPAAPSVQESSYNIYRLLPQDVTILPNGISIQLENNFRKAEGDAQYSWRIVDCNAKVTVVESPLAAENTWSYTFSQPGTYLLYATVADPYGNSDSKAAATIVADLSAKNLFVTPARDA